MKKVFLLTMLPVIAHSADWYCDQVASAWVEAGKTLSSCGVGSSKDEATAKTKAFENAKDEFNKVCAKDTSCGDKIVNIDPQRTDCKKLDDIFICKRLFYFHITDEIKKEGEPQVIVKEVPQVIIQKEVEVIEKENVTVHNHYNIVNQPVSVIRAPATLSEGNEKSRPYRSYIRSVGSVKIYETNTPNYYTGIQLMNPSDTQIEDAIRTASKSGAMNYIYIIRN